MMIFRPALIVLFIAHLALAAMADQLLDNVTEAENQARAVLGFVQEAPRSPDCSIAEADSARQSLRDLITSLVAYKNALVRNDGTELTAYRTVLQRDTSWRSQRMALQYSETESEFLTRMDDILQVVDQETADR